MLKNELQKAFINKRFLIVIFIEILLILWYTLDEAIPLMNDYINPLNEHFITWEYPDKMANRLPNGAYYMWIGLNFSKQYMLLYAVIPILAAIPYGDSLYREIHSHYEYHMILKAGKRQYYTTKMLALFISGGTIAMFPFLLSFLINAAMMPLEQVHPVMAQYLHSTAIMSKIFYKEPLIYCLLFLALTFICYGLFNCFCFVGAYLLNNRFVVTIFPFAIYFISRVIEVSILSTSIISPWFSFQIKNINKRDLSTITITMIIMITIIALVYLFKCRKKGDEL